MPRQSRLVVPDLPLHIVHRGNNRVACFREEGDYLAEWDRPIVPVTPLPEVGESARQLEPDWRATLDTALLSRPELSQDRLSIDVAEIQLETTKRFVLATECVFVVR